MDRARKYFCLIMTMILLCSSTQVFATIFTVISQEYTNSDFDDGGWDGWTTTRGNDNAPQITSVSDKTPGQSVLLSHQATSTGNIAMTKTLGSNASGKVVFEARIKLVDHQSSRTNYTSRELFNIFGGTNNPLAISLIRISSGYIRDRNTNALFMYNQNTWYHIKVVVDFSTADQPVKYYIDEAEIVKNPANQTDIPAFLSVKNLTDFKTTKLISYSNVNDSCETYIDDVKIYQLQDVDAGLPDLTASTPQNNAVNVSENTAIGLTFNNPIQQNAFSTGHISVTGGAASIASITPTADNKGCTIKFAQPLAFNTTYAVTIQNVQDIYNQAMPNKSFTFTTRQGYLKPDTIEFYKDSVNEANRITESGLSSGNIYGVVGMTNYGSTDAAATLIMGLYDGDTLKQVMYYSPAEPIKAGASETLSAHLQVVLPDSGAETYHIKLLNWDSLEGMSPVWQPVIFNTTGVQE